MVTALCGWEPMFFGWISQNREGATPPKDNSPPKRVVPPTEDIRHPQSAVTNLKNIHENVSFIFTLPGCLLNILS